MNDAQFPIHPNDRHLLASVPWGMLLPHETQIQKNHGQSLATLAGRGGLSILEVYYTLRELPHQRSPLPLGDALAYIGVRVELHKVYQLLHYWSHEADVLRLDLQVSKEALQEAQQQAEAQHKMDQQLILDNAMVFSKISAMLDAIVARLDSVEGLLRSFYPPQ